MEDSTVKVMEDVNLLLQILSRVPIKEAIEMSKVCQRWRGLWKQIPILKFDQADHVMDDRHLLVHFINRFLDDHTENIECFHLSAPLDETRGDVNNWIQRVVEEKKVKVIELLLESAFDFALPVVELVRLDLHSLDCSSLVALTLEYDYFDLGGNVVLGSLKRLNLCSTTFLDSKVSDMLEGCPNLECLSIEDCRGIGNVHINFLHLSELTLLKCVGMNMIVINVPSLQYFKFDCSSLPLLPLWLLVPPLRILRIQLVEGTDLEFELLENFLENTIVLEFVVVSFYSGTVERWNYVSEELLRLQGAHPHQLIKTDFGLN